MGGAGSVRAGDAVLVEGVGEVWGEAVERFAAEGGHLAGCACCVTHSQAAAALDRLFQRRARGQIPFFRRILAVTATPEGDMAVFAALRNDPLVSSRFRLED